MNDNELRAQKGMTSLFHASIEEQIADASKSVRRWWWEYLRLSQDYWFLCQTCEEGEPVTTDKKLAQVFRDFGNVYDLKFEHWWRERGSKLFEERSDFPKVREVAPAQIATTEFNDGKILVEIPIQLTRATVVAQISRILEQYASLRPTNRLAITSSDYPISPISIKLEAVIQPAHEVYCLHRELIEKPKALARLGKQTDTSAIQADANLFRIGKVYGLSPANADLRGDSEVVTAKTVAMRREVRRVLDRALTLIHHVERGEFPPLNKKVTAAKKARFSDRQMKEYAAIEHKWWALDLHSTLIDSKIEKARAIHYTTG
jgi:hypothetical protein